MDKKVVKFGIVGLRRGRQIIDSAIGEETIQLRAICDRDADRLEDAKKHFENDKGVKDLLCFDSYEEFLASDIDAVIIASGADVHVPMVVQALDAGKHVLSEIPAVNSLEEAKILKDAVNKHPELKYMAGENCCFWRFVEEWKKIIDKGLIGEPVIIEAEYLHHEFESEEKWKLSHNPDGTPNWRVYLNAIQYLTHELGPILYMLGDDRCVSVSGFAPDFETISYKVGKSNEMAVFKTAKGAIIKIFIGFGVHVGFDHNFTIYGTKGSIETDRSKMVVDAHSFLRCHDLIKEKIELPITTRYPGEKDDGHGGCDTQMVKAFAKCIIEDTKSPIDVDMGIQMSIAGLYAQESVEKGSIPIQIPEF